jgi:hypothetical protein
MYTLSVSWPLSARRRLFASFPLPSAQACPKKIGSILRKSQRSCHITFSVGFGNNRCPLTQACSARVRILPATSRDLLLVLVLFFYPWYAARDHSSPPGWLQRLMVQALALAHTLAHVPVAAPPLDQLLVGAVLDDVAAIENEDVVVVADGAETMSDGDGGAALRRCVDGVLHKVLALRVERARGLVEQQHRQVADQLTRSRAAGTGRPTAPRPSSPRPSGSPAAVS